MTCVAGAPLARDEFAATDGVDGVANTSAGERWTVRSAVPVSPVPVSPDLMRDEAPSAAFFSEVGRATSVSRDELAAAVCAVNSFAGER